MMPRDAHDRLLSRAIWVDFMDRNSSWRVPLDNPGTVEDLSRTRVTLVAGMRLVLYTLDANTAGEPNDLVAIGTVEWDSARGRRWAVVDDSSLVHVSELGTGDREAFATARHGPD